MVSAGLIATGSEPPSRGRVGAECSLGATRSAGPGRGEQLRSASFLSKDAPKTGARSNRVVIMSEGHHQGREIATSWIPAFAGMTKRRMGVRHSILQEANPTRRRPLPASCPSG